MGRRNRERIARIEKGDMLRVGHVDFDLDSVLRFYWEYAISSALKERAVNLTTFVDAAKRRVVYRFCEPATRGDDEIRNIIT